MHSLKKKKKEFFRSSVRIHGIITGSFFQKNVKETFHFRVKVFHIFITTVVIYKMAKLMLPKENIIRSQIKTDQQ